MNNCGLSNFELLKYINFPHYMQFKLQYSFSTKFEYSFQHSYLMIGSCFADEVGNIMHSDLFDVMVNPHGVIFNPVSISKLLHDYATNHHYKEKDLLFHSGLFMSLKHHGKFRGKNAKQLIDDLNEITTKASTQLMHSDVLIITLGSAWIYELIDNKEIVANCHKLPASYFTKRLLTIDEVVDALFPILNTSVFNSKKILFTVSPVRYIKDGLHENNLSKSTLHLAIHKLIGLLSNAEYFPSYEIVIDELRDYRFFKEDFIHPNDIAIKYVYERFCESALDMDSQNALKEIRSLSKLKNHRPIIKDETEQMNLQNAIAQKTEYLFKKYPFLTDRINQI